MTATVLLLTPELRSIAAPDAIVFDGPRSMTREQALGLLGVEQAVLRALVTGDWEV